VAFVCWIAVFLSSGVGAVLLCARPKPVATPQASQQDADLLEHCTPPFRVG
jgi:hypothetical protein